MLPNIAFLSFVVIAASLGQVGTGDDKEARAVVDKAIRAMGGKEKLVAIRAATWKGKGKFHGFGLGVDFQGVFATHGVDKGRTEMTFDFMGRKVVMIAVLNGDKGWVKSNDTVVELDKKTIDTQKEHAYFIELAALTPLARNEKVLKLSALVDAKVESADAFVVKVSRKNVPDVHLFFDKKTNLPIKAEFKSLIDKKEELFEIRLDDYKEVKGVKVAMKVVLKHNGKLFQETEISDFAFVDRLEEKSLEKP